MPVYVINQSVTAATAASAPIVVPQEIAEKYITRCEVIFDTGTPAGMPVGVAVMVGNQMIWPAPGSNQKWIRGPAVVPIGHDMAIEHVDNSRLINVYFYNTDAAAHVAEVRITASMHAPEILQLGLLSVLKGLSNHLQPTGAKPEGLPAQAKSQIVLKGGARMIPQAEGRPKPRGQAEN